VDYFWIMYYLLQLHTFKEINVLCKYFMLLLEIKTIFSSVPVCVSSLKFSVTKNKNKNIMMKEPTFRTCQNSVPHPDTVSPVHITITYSHKVHFNIALYAPQSSKLPTFNKFHSSCNVSCISHLNHCLACQYLLN
jgi:hypothetical protein